MKKYILNTLALAAASFSIVACSPKVELEPLDRSQRPEPGPAPEAAFPEYETVELPNGLTLYIIESERQPTVTYRLMFRSGGLFDGDKAGLGEFVANMLDRGVEGKSAFELASEADFIGGSIGAMSSSDFTAVSVSGLSKYKSELLEILGEVVLKPTFPESELEVLKQQTLSNLAQSRKDPSDLAGKLRRKLVYGETGYGLYQTEESVASISRDDLIAFHAAHFKPNNASLAIVGNVDAKEISKAVEKTFADWKKGEVPALPDLEFPKLEGVSVHLVDRPESVQSVILVAQQSFARSNPDTAQMRIVMSVLGGSSFSGRMMQNLREDKGYTYGAYSYAANAARFGAIVTSTEVRNEVTAPAVKEILYEINRMVEEPVEDSELAVHRQYLSGNYMLSLERSAVIAQQVQDIDIYSLAPDYYQKYVTQLMGVTSDRAQILAKEHLRPNDLAIVIVGKAEEVAESLKEFGPVTIYNEKFEVVE